MTSNGKQKLSAFDHFDRDENGDDVGSTDAYDLHSFAVGCDKALRFTICYEFDQTVRKTTITIERIIVDRE
jgi:hypothetical protein